MVLTTYYFNSGKNTALSKNGISRKHITTNISLNSTRIKMNQKLNYLCNLRFSMKFKNYRPVKNYWSRY